MKTSSPFRFFTAAAAAACIVTVTAIAEHPQLMNYQGRVAVDGTNFDGTGLFKFALVSGDGATTYWSNNGTSSNGAEPSAAVSLSVTKGLYSVLLGDTSLTNMTSPVPATVFAANSDVRLRVWFNDGSHTTQQLSPDQRIAAVGYAMVAASVADSSLVKILPDATQTVTLGDNEEKDLIDVQLNGGNNTNLGTSGTRDLLSMKVNGTFSINGFPHSRDMERFRFDNAGGLLSVGGTEEFEGTIPVEGSGTRFMWYPGRRAIRAGYVDGTQWDDANIGLYSSAFGYNARASGDYGFASGQNVVAANSWSTAFGHYSTASGAVSVALGYYANTNTRQGSFVFSDRSVLDDNNIVTDEAFKSANNHTFNVRASGGYYLYTNSGVSTGLRMSHLTPSNVAYGSLVWTDRSSDSSVSPTAQNQTIFRSSGGYWLYSDSGLTAGVTLAPGAGAWNNLSDRNMKDNFSAVDTRAVLRGVLDLPISTWNYKSQNETVRHIGPMAQDFQAAFGVGEDDKHISTIDPDGVALAAIQGLNEELRDRDAKISAQQEELKEQKTKLTAIEAQLQEQRKLIDQIRGEKH
jgi:hypothetical protein